MSVDEGKRAREGLTEVGLEGGAVYVVAQLAYGLLLDLTHALTRQVVLHPYLIKRHLGVATDAEEALDDLGLTLGEVRQHLVDLAAEGLIEQYAIRRRRIVTGQYVQEAILLSLDKRGVDGDMPSCDLERLGDLVLGEVQLLGQFLRDGARSPART